MARIRQFALDSSGLSVVPLTPGGALPPQINATRGIVNANDGSTNTNLTVGGVINVAGTNLATSSTAVTLPPPTVLGGSGVVFNDVPLPLLKTSSGQIQAQIPTNVSGRTNIVQVRSLGTGLQSAPVVVTVQSPTNPPGGGTPGAPSVITEERNNGRIAPKVK